jgi:putative peptidoglycan lipid II flippase
MDAFVLAFTIPTFVVTIIAGAFAGAIVPVYLEVRERDGRDRARQLVGDVTGWSVVLLACVAAIVAVVVPIALPVLGGNFNAHKLELTRDLFFVLVPTIVFVGVATLWEAVLSAEERFAPASTLPAVTPVAAAVAMVAAAPLIGIYSIVVGLVVGSITEAVVAGLWLRRLHLAARPRWGRADPHLRRVLWQYLPTSVGSLLMATTVIVDQIMAAWLGRGSIASLAYANRVVSFPLGIAGTALATVALPRFSHIAATGDWPRVRRAMTRDAGLVGLASLPLVAATWALGEPLVHLLFQRGSFTAEDTKHVASVVRYLVLQTPFYLAGIVLVRLVVSIRANRILVMASAVNVVSNVVLNLILMRWLGLRGIALSTAFVYAISSSIVWLALRRRLRDVDGPAHPQECGEPRLSVG